ncbi:MAG: ribonuclease VapC, partial [Thermoprotei archaeon]
DIILSLTSRERGILITNDRELRRKARRLNIPVGFLNIEEKRVIVEYFP